MSGFVISVCFFTKVGDEVSFLIDKDSKLKKHVKEFVEIWANDPEIGPVLRTFIRPPS